MAIPEEIEMWSDADLDADYTRGRARKMVSDPAGLCLPPKEVMAMPKTTWSVQIDEAGYDQVQKLAVQLSLTQAGGGESTRAGRDARPYQGVGD